METLKHVINLSKIDFSGVPEDLMPTIRKLQSKVINKFITSQRSIPDEYDALPFPSPFIIPDIFETAIDLATVDFSGVPDELMPTISNLQMDLLNRLIEDDDMYFDPNRPGLRLSPNDSSHSTPVPAPVPIPMSIPAFESAPKPIPEPKEELISILQWMHNNNMPGSGMTGKKINSRVYGQFKEKFPKKCQEMGSVSWNTQAYPISFSPIIKKAYDEVVNAK